MINWHWLKSDVCGFGGINLWPVVNKSEIPVWNQWLGGFVKKKKKRVENEKVLLRVPSFDQRETFDKYYII